jgi:hypothetical protein
MGDNLRDTMKNMARDRILAYDNKQGRYTVAED